MRENSDTPTIASEVFPSGSQRTGSDKKRYEKKRAGNQADGIFSWSCP